VSGQEFTIAVLGLAARFRFSITSWGRSVAHNAAVGGHPDSMHLYFLAVDCELDDPLDEPAFVQTAERLGLQVIREPRHLHVQIPRFVKG